MQVYIRPKKFLLGSSLPFNLKEGPVRCAKVCDKSWVILERRRQGKQWHLLHKDDAKPPTYPCKEYYVFSYITHPFTLT